ncbi:MULTISPECIES: hypothetical protein [Rhizobium]|jgi:hypothetical protein|uniref:Uncharacterized protein n=1 Tax=Rhizobium wenxiniae TaxID=1737357 RepID=A0A7W9Y6M1_9HYPH|nr:hypothetical protein [Rhizobium wenxiniae]MBB6162123.1 hypothetical protein [Rhizobium wenxiniae]GGF77287.1 hypothetical protein GCM10010924_00380 [Rhizobium wenxiniae]
MKRDLTIEDVLSDPLIAQLRRADGISTPEFAQLLHAAAQIYGGGKSPRRSDKTTFVLCETAEFAPERRESIPVGKTQPKAGVPCLGW